MDLALFDFDGTITHKGTYPGFVRLAVRPRRRLIGGAVLAPVIALHRVGLLSDLAIRIALSRVAFVGDDPARVALLGERYCREVLPDLIRPVAFERIQWHRDRGDRVIVVSASLAPYLEPWCRALGVEAICTQLEVRRGRLTGGYLQGDCSGVEKVRRILERCDPAAYETVYAYGDTEEDRQMLALAHRRYFRWTEVADIPPPSRATRRGDGGI